MQTKILLLFLYIGSFPSSQPSPFGSFPPPTSTPFTQTTPTIPLLNPPPGGFPAGFASLPPPITSQTTPPQQRVPPSMQAIPTQQVATPPQPRTDPFANLGLLSAPVDPLAVLDSTTVSMESIQTGKGRCVSFKI